MGDETEQYGKRRKSLEGREDLAVSGPAAPSSQPRRRDSLEAMCSASFIEKEANRSRSNRVSIDNCGPNQSKRLSQDLSRDVDKINEQLSQLLFSGDQAATEDPKGGSLDTRRTREPQSYYNRTRRLPAASGLDTPDLMPWQTAPNADASTALPWMQAGPTASKDDGGEGGLPWSTGSDMPPTQSSLDAVVERSGRRSMQGRRSSLSRAQPPTGQESPPAAPWETGGQAPMETGQADGMECAAQAGNAPHSVEALTAPSGSTTTWHRKIIRSTKAREKMQS